MNQQIPGEVTVNNLPSKNKLFRFVEKQIAHWIKDHSAEISNFENFVESPIHFQVSFMEEDGDKQISCETEIQLGNHTYRAAELSTDPQQALLHSLKHLHAH